MFSKDSITVAVVFDPFDPLRRPPCGPEKDDQDGRPGRAATPSRVALRPEPEAWAPDELLTPREAAELAGPSGPTGRHLRTAIAAGRLAGVRIAGRIYTTRAALAAMPACGRHGSARKAAAGKTDWDAHLASLLGRSGRTAE